MNADNSEASVGKAYLAQIGVRGWREVQPDAPDWLVATVLETYYGGRTEARIRRVAVPGVATDVTSEYPTVFVLMGLWRWLVATGVDWADEPVARTVRWLARLTPATLLDRVAWPRLARLCLVEPGPDDLLPTRARFQGDADNVALAHRAAGGPPQWYTLADVAASTLATGHVPRLLRVLAFRPRAPQDGLVALDVGGDAAHRIDPYRDDLIASLVELRAELRSRQDPTSAAVAQAVKAAANSVGYGAPIEVNTVEWAQPQTVTVHRPDATSYRTKVSRTEEPGRYFHPLLATLVAGAGRLLLALVIRLVADRGGHYAFCDTDSVFVVATEDGGFVPCPGGPAATADGRPAVRALTWREVDQVVDALRPLNPFGGRLAGGSVLKVEPENLDPATGAQRRLEAFVVASKRYALFTRDEGGRPVLAGTAARRRRSEHGLGHLLPPTDPRPDAETASWYDQWWLLVLAAELGLSTPRPAWLRRPAVGRLTVTSLAQEAPFRPYNATRRYERRVRPWGFAVTAYPAALDRAGEDRGMLVAPYQRDPRRWTGMRWWDRSQPDVPAVRVRTGDATFVLPGRVTVTSMGDYLTDYRTHPEAKAAGPDGEPCTPATVGLLGPLTVAVEGPLRRIGKETNRLAEEADVVNEEADRPLVYGRRTCRGCAAPVGGRRLWCTEACRKRAERRTATTRLHIVNPSVGKHAGAGLHGGRTPPPLQVYGSHR